MQAPVSFRLKGHAHCPSARCQILCWLVWFLTKDFFEEFFATNLWFGRGNEFYPIPENLFDLLPTMMGKNSVVRITMKNGTDFTAQAELVLIRSEMTVAVLLANFGVHQTEINT